MLNLLAKQRGASLIEVLVTVLILGSSLMALAALHTKSLQYNHGAFIRSQANILAYDIIDRMRINSINLASYQSALGAFDTASTEPSVLAGKDLHEWRRNVSTFLPGGQGGILCDDMLCTITIAWAPPDASSAEELESFSYSTRF